MYVGQDGPLWLGHDGPLWLGSVLCLSVTTLFLVLLSISVIIKNVEMLYVVGMHAK